MAELPIQYKDPIYGQKDETFLDFSAPGILCSILYFLAIGLTALTLVIERKEGLFTRSLVSGVTMAEILIGHILAQFIVMAVQVVVLLIFTFLVFKIYSAGSLILVILFLLLLGMMGMCLGFVVSAATKDETEATQMSLAFFMPFMLISGIIWPIESMPEGLQVFSKYCTPLTLPVVGIRVVFGRGWDLTYYEVWRGYVLIIAWSIGFLIISLIISKIKRFN